MNSVGKHLERLWLEIDLYLEILALLQETDEFWIQYTAFKNLCEKKGYNEQPRRGLAGRGEASLGAAG